MTSFGGFRFFLAAVLVSTMASAAGAQSPGHAMPVTVVLKDGDTLRGTLAPSHPAGLSLRTSKFGTLSIPWTEVASLTMPDPVRAIGADGLVVVGVAVWSSQALVVQAPSQSFTIPLEQLQLLEWVGEPPASWLERWKLVAASSTSISRGNTETLDAAISGSATYQGLAYGLGLYGGRSHSGVGSGDGSVTTADASQLGGRLDRYLREQLFVFGSTDFKYDRFQQVLRLWGTFGLGVDAVSTRHAVLSLMAGIARGRDAARVTATSGAIAGREVTGSRTYNQLQMSEGLRRRMGSWGVELSEDWVVYRQLGKASAQASVAGGPSIRGAVPLTGQWRSELTAQATVPLTSHLAWQGQFRHSYVNHPYPGSKESDVSVTLGFSLNIGNGALGGYSGSSSNVGTLAGQGGVHNQRRAAQ